MKHEISQYRKNVLAMRVGFTKGKFGGIQNVMTPEKVCQEILNKLVLENKMILVMFNPEFVNELVFTYGVNPENIYFMGDEGLDGCGGNKYKIVMFKMGVPEGNIVYWSNEYDILTEEEFGMKFDLVIGNPPYNGKAALHQQFFVKGFSVLNPDGIIAFIQPATMYFNKKNNRRKNPEREMLEIVNGHAVEIVIKNENVFSGAQVATKLAITIASKKKSSGFTIEYENGVIENCDENGVSGINQLQIPSSIFISMRNKVASLCQKNGSFQDVVWSDNNTKASFAKIRGHVGGNSDFYTIVPRKNSRPVEKFNCGPNEFGIPLKNQNELENFYKYCELFFTRFCLAILKFNTNSHMGELELIPLMDFSTQITDNEMFNLVNFTSEEIEWIYKTIPTYYL